MRTTRNFERLVIIATLMSASAAGAHTVVADGGSFTTGFRHPPFGLDHLLAVLAVGLWATQLGGRTFWSVPFAFVSVMMGGFVLGAQGAALPLVEAGIASSVLILGLLVACAARLPTTTSLALVGGFALFHGHAHGSELEHTASALAFTLGFLLATAALLLVGMCVGRRLKHSSRLKTLRLSGAVIAAGGLLLWV